MNWLSQQLSGVSDQILALILSAILGGVTSWGITQRFDRKSREIQARRDEVFRTTQTARDERQRLFLYRQSRYFEWQLFLSGVKWWASFSTSTGIPRDCWYCIVNNSTGKDVTNLQVEILSIEHPAEVFLGPAYSDPALSEILEPSSSADATFPDQPSWAVPAGGRIYFPIGALIDEAEMLRFWTEDDIDSPEPNRHLFPISPHDSMLEMRNPFRL